MVYEALALCFSYPRGRVLEWLAGRAWMPELEQAVGILGERLILPLRTMDEELRDVDELDLSLAQEYTRLFINALPRVPVPPYASVHRKGEGVVYGKSTVEVMKFYRKAGFHVDCGYNDLPDHISLEFEFLGIISAKEARSRKRDGIHERLRQEFLSHHMLPWVPVFCKKIVTHSRSRFYTGLAVLTAEFMDIEKRTLSCDYAIGFGSVQESLTPGDVIWARDTV
jgi:putative dimethyl sulfoxide reductase chaperone